jgi:hypothetical protein
MKHDKHSPRTRPRPLASAELGQVQGGVDATPTVELDANGRLRKTRTEESNEQG